jgi:menaquinone-9 beta-reductase
VVVVGAGSAGSAAAWQLARAGWRVALVEERRLLEGGARWMNAVAPSMFTRADVPPPAPPELSGVGAPYWVLGPDGEGPVDVGETPIPMIDMPRLASRLQGLARRAGVRAFELATAERLVLDGERPVALEIETETPDGRLQTMTLRARLFVDATGLAGALRAQVPRLARDCPAPAGADLCSAAQEVRAVRDKDGARRYLERRGARPGTVLAHLGVSGGYSTCYVVVSTDLSHVELVTGVTADGRHGTGLDLIERLLHDEPWIGVRRSGGSSLIPLRRPYARQAAPGIALIGDAGCHVLTAHGSGVGPGLIAARHLGEATRGVDDPGSEEATWAYQAAFLRDAGAVCAAYDVFRRLSQRLTGEDIALMIASGLTTPGSTRAILEHRIPPTDPAELGQLLPAVLRVPDLALRIAPTIARVFAVHRLYQRYPAQVDERALATWMRAEQDISGI